MGFAFCSSLSLLGNFLGGRITLIICAYHVAIVVFIN